MNYAKLENSPRLQRVLARLADGKPHSTRDIMHKALVCAVNSCVDELRENGFNISCKRTGRLWLYQLKDVATKSQTPKTILEEIDNLR